MLYFYNLARRYVGCRERKPGEDTPSCATELPVEIWDGQEAFFIDGAWNVRDVPPREEFVYAPSLDEQVTALTDAVNLLLGL